MVVGLETFKEYFKEHQDCYLIIGGTACDIIIEEANFTPRATNDIDVILIVEAITPTFVKRFWEFVKEANTQFSKRKPKRKIATASKSRKQLTSLSKLSYSVGYQM